MADHQPHDLLAIRGTIFREGRLVPQTTIVVCSGTIERVGRTQDVALPRGVPCLEAADQVVVPGFIDLHIHGAGGCRSEDDPVGVARHVVRHGTTFFLPTMISNDLAAMVTAAEHSSAQAGPVAGGATIGGVHLEGPYLNPRYGAQQAIHNIEATPAGVARLIDACGGHPRMVTIAPERPGALAAIAQFKQAGALVALGHSDANEEEYRASRSAGVSHATHLFNAMPPKQWMTAQDYRGKKPIGVEELILGDDGVSADLLCDATGAHVHPSLLKIAIACKGPQKLCLITDAMPAAGQPPGEYKLADGQSIFTTADEDVARLANGVLCGSVLSMCGTIRNWLRHTGAPLEQALLMASEAPARALGLFERKGSIAAGKDADLVWLDAEQRVTRTMVHGRFEYQREDRVR